MRCENNRAGLRFGSVSLSETTMTSDQNSSSSFHELRLAAGYETQAELRREIANITLSDWDRGVAKPRRRHLQKLAQLFKVTPAQLVKTLWHEEVGSACPCGCGNKKTLPNYDDALHLPVERVCPECSIKKFIAIFLNMGTRDFAKTVDLRNR